MKYGFDLISRFNRWLAVTVAIDSAYAEVAL
jgi:hypothetical protein